MRPFDCSPNPIKTLPPLSPYVYAEGEVYVLVIRFHVYMKLVQWVFWHNIFIFL